MDTENRECLPYRVESSGEWFRMIWIRHKHSPSNFHPSSFPRTNGQTWEKYPQKASCGLDETTFYRYRRLNIATNFIFLSLPPSSIHPLIGNLPSHSDCLATYEWASSTTCSSLGYLGNNLAARWCYWVPVVPFAFLIPPNSHRCWMPSSLKIWMKHSFLLRVWGCSTMLVSSPKTSATSSTSISITWILISGKNSTSSRWGREHLFFWHDHSYS